MNQSQLRQILDEYIDEFKEKVSDMPHYANSLVYSTIFAFCALCKYYNIQVIIDSGTGKHGQSCETFAKIFPNATVITIDNHKLYNTEGYIKNRLSNYSNITFITGDSAKIIDNIVKQYSNKRVAIMYDGPKREIALNLYKKTRQNKNVVFAGFDDLYNIERNKPVYSFLTSLNPILFTDQDWFWNKYHFLDKKRYFIDKPGDPPIFHEGWAYDHLGKRSRACIIINNI